MLNSRTYRAYVLAVIWFVLLLRFLDLQVISVLMESIKKEFAVSDTQLGLLTGFAFSLFYGGLGIPVAFLADRSNRTTIIAAAVSVWSAMTAACGLASTFPLLLMARLGVGIGEAGGHAPAYSLIADYFPARRRASIFAILNSAVPIGVFTGLLVGGMVNARFGWRAVFWVVGLPGLALGLLALLTLRDPRLACGSPAVKKASAATLSEELTALLDKRSYRHLVLATSLFTLGALASGIWIPSFFIRVHHMPGAQVATWLACIYGGGGLVGALSGGILADYLVARTCDYRWHVWIAGICSMAILPFTLFVYLWSDPITALLVHTGATILMHMWMGPVYGLVQSLAGAQRRAMAAAINLLSVNLLAYGLGPLLVGVGSDALRAIAGDQSLRYSILTVVVLAYLWAGVHFFLAAKTVRQELEIESRAVEPVVTGIGETRTPEILRT
jgi:predicted MFS family arabinose efflux permease